MQTATSPCNQPQELGMFQRVEKFRPACGADRSVGQAELGWDCRWLIKSESNSRPDQAVVSVQRSLHAWWAGAKQAVASPRKKLADMRRATRVLSHTLRLGKSPLLKRDKQSVAPCSGHLRSIGKNFVQETQPVHPGSLMATQLLPLLSCGASPKLLTKALTT